MAMRNEIKFLLNGTEQIVTDIRPDTTLLTWLRADKQLTGTKEGCAEGDCGACTIMLSSMDKEQNLQHQAVNSCILFLPMIDGAAITTIEGLASPDGELHPAQKAVIERHGAQCGFCTPGFVMSMVAGFEAGLNGSSQQADQILAGNLCRCTGYSALADALISLAKQEKCAWFASKHKGIKDYLSKSLDSLAIETEQQSFYAPTSMAELENIYGRNPDAQILAGGTDIGLWVTKHHHDLPCIISILRIAELQKITKTDSHITIGAGVSHDRASTELADDFAGFDEVWKRFGSKQVRNSGTVCGNIANASPIGDINPCFLSLGASLTLNKEGIKRTLSMEEFFLAYGKQDRQAGEFIESVTLPRLSKTNRLYAYKLSKRFDQDISAVLMAIWLDIKDDIIIDLRIACGGMAAIPKRAYHSESLLKGRSLTQAPIGSDILAALRQDFMPISDMRASAEYRLKSAQNLLKKMFYEYQEPDSYMRLYSLKESFSDVEKR